MQYYRRSREQRDATALGIKGNRNNLLQSLKVFVSATAAVHVCQHDAPT